MNKVIVLSLLILLGDYLLGQLPQSGTALSGMGKFDLGLQGIGFGYESPLSKSITMETSTGFGGGYNIADGSMDFQVLKPALYLAVTPKYFYNRNHRAGKGRQMENNSGNYLGVRCKYSLPLYKRNNIIRNSVLTNFHWGIQRSLGKQWGFNVHAGAGYASDIGKGAGTFYPAIEFRVSHIF